MRTSTKATLFQPINILNETQRNIIKGILKFHFDDIAELKPDEAIKAYEAMITETASPEDKALFEQIDVWDTIQKVREILSHPCPQNRKGSIVDTSKSNVGPKPITDFPELKNGIVEGRVYWWANSDASKVMSEPQGLLGLTARDDSTTAPVTKRAVVNYIHQLTKRVIADQKKLVTGEHKENESKLQKVPSCMDLSRMVSRSQWLVCISEDKQNNTAIYLEGMRENGTLFLDRYELRGSPSEFSYVSAKSLNPRVFDTHQQNEYQIFGIRNLRGLDLKDLIEREVMKNNIDRGLRPTSDADSAIYTNNFNREWSINKLHLIGINVQDQPIPPLYLRIYQAIGEGCHLLLLLAIRIYDCCVCCKRPNIENNNQSRRQP